MQVNRQQREILKGLSLRLWGISSKWEKIADRNNIVDHYKDDPSARRYVQSQSPHGDTKKKGPVVRETTALNLGLVKELSSDVVKTPVHRKMNFGELFNYLIMLWDSKIIGHLKATRPADLIPVFVCRLVGNELNYSFDLMHPDYENEEALNDFCALIEKLPDNLQEPIVDSTLDPEGANDARRTVDAFDAKSFVQAVIDRVEETKDENRTKEGKIGRRYERVIMRAEEEIRADKSGYKIPATAQQQG